MNRIERVKAVLLDALQPVFLDVINESGQHSVPRGSETHVRVVAVSAAFEGKAPLGRHRVIQAALAGELASGLHALAIEARTPAEWAATQERATLTSPPCHSGTKPSPL